MADPAINICAKIIDLMKANSNFDTINGFSSGIEYKVPSQNYPLCEVVITDESPDPQDTTAYYRRFNGFLRFSIQQMDRPVFVNRVNMTTSFSVVYGYAQRAIELLGHKTSNNTLGGLQLDTGGVVQEFDVGDGAGYGEDDRTNSWEMQSVVPFTCLTREPRDFS